MVTSYTTKVLGNQLSQDTSVGYAFIRTDSANTAHYQTTTGKEVTSYYFATVSSSIEDKIKDDFIDSNISLIDQLQENA
jgi:hypothetical protein